jgi:hypothetical protein
MLSQEEIDEQLRLLRTHRRTLAVLLRQQAAIGLAFSPPSIVNGIYEARANIQRIKAALDAAGVAMTADPNDEEAPDVVLVLRATSRRMLSAALAASAALALLLVAGVALRFFGDSFMLRDRAVPATAGVATAPSAGPSAHAPTTTNATAQNGAAEPTHSSVPTGANGKLLSEYTFSNGSAVGWAGSPEQWQVVQDKGNFVYQGQGTADKTTATSPPNTAALTTLRDYAVETRVRVVQPGPTDDKRADFWFALRAHHEPKPCLEYDFNFSIGTTEAFIFRNGPGDCFTTLTQGAGMIDASTWTTIRAEVLGAQLRLFVNGTQVLSASDDRVADGFFYINVGSGAIVQFDDMRVYEL